MTSHHVLGQRRELSLTLRSQPAALKALVLSVR